MVSANRERWVTLSLSFLLVGITLAAYQSVFHAGFIWDDDNYVINNIVLRDRPGLARLWSDLHATPQYYPLTFTSLWLEFQLWGLDPLPYHLTNVLLHALNSLLFWRILRRLEVPGAILAAAIFALHPIHVESVAWITERKNVLSGAFYLSAALAHLRFATPATPRVQRWCWYTLALVAFACAMASKTVTSTLPVALILARAWDQGRVLRSDVIALLPFFALGLSGGLVTIGLERNHVGAQGSDWAFTTFEQCLIAGRVLWFYLATLAWPIDLTFIYPRWDIDASSPWSYLYPVASAAAFIVLSLGRRRCGVGPLLAALFYVVTLLPALGFFNVYPMRYSFVADHFSYLATLGPIALFAAAVTRGSAANASRARAGGVLATLLLLTLGSLTWRQGQIYANEETLWRDTIKKNPNGWLGHVSLGRVLADGGRIDEAVAHMRTAVAVAPTVPEPHNALGSLLDSVGQFPEAEIQFRHALTLEPRNYEVYTNLGIVLTELARPSEGLAQLATALQLKPEYVPAHFHAGQALERLGRRTLAAQSYAHALLLAPNLAQAHAGLCRLQIDTARLQDAENHCRAAIQGDPQLLEAEEGLARVLQRQGRAAEALAHAAHATSQRQYLARAYLDRGRDLVRQGQPLAAAAHFRESLQQHPDQAVHNELSELLAATRRGETNTPSQP